MNNSLVIQENSNYIFFAEGIYTYAFNAKYVLDILQLVELQHPESMSGFIIGLLEYKNTIIKVIDIKSVLNLEATPYTLNAKIIIVKTRNEIFGIVVDDIKTVRQINTEFFSPPPYDTTESCLEGIYTDNEVSSTVVNLEQIARRVNSPTKQNSRASFSLMPSDSASKEILQRRLAHYGKQTHKVNYEIIKSSDTYITFKLNNVTSCAKILEVAGFYKLQSLKLTKVPCTPDFIMGITNINGRYITVIDLLKYTENKSIEITKDSTVIVIEYEDYQLGILADGIGEAVEIDETLINLSADKTSGCLSEFVMNGSLYLFLSAKKLFGDEKLYVS